MNIGNNAAVISFEIIKEGKPCPGLEVIMPSEPDFEQMVFAPRVKIVSDFVFASTEMAERFGGEGIEA